MTVPVDPDSSTSTTMPSSAEKSPPVRFHFPMRAPPAVGIVVEVVGSIEVVDAVVSLLTEPHPVKISIAITIEATCRMGSSGRTRCASFV
jgi:hypothetical protein